MAKETIIMLRQDAPTDAELNALQNTFPPGTEFEFVRSDAANYIEHDEHCQELRPIAVFLPKDRPIPALAMEHGHRHIVLRPEGLMELVAIVPQFIPYVP